MVMPYGEGQHQGAEANPAPYYIKIKIHREGLIEFSLPPEWRQGFVWVTYDEKSVDVSRVEKDNYTKQIVDFKTGIVLHQSALPPMNEIFARARYLNSNTKLDLCIHLD